MGVCRADGGEVTEVAEWEDRVSFLMKVNFKIGMLDVGCVPVRNIEDLNVQPEKVKEEEKKKAVKVDNRRVCPTKEMVRELANGKEENKKENQRAPVEQMGPQLLLLVLQTEKEIKVVRKQLRVKEAVVTKLKIDRPQLGRH